MDWWDIQDIHLHFYIGRQEEHGCRSKPSSQRAETRTRRLTNSTPHQHM
jgi:hypothetical protein